MQELQTQNFQPPYFYMGLAEDERRAELLTKIRTENYDWIGKVVAEKGDYVVRYARFYGSYPILEEVWDGCDGNHIVEVRDKELALELLEIIPEHGRELYPTIAQLEKRYCKEKNWFMNYYGDEHKQIVAAFIKGLKREIANNS